MLPAPPEPLQSQMMLLGAGSSGAGGDTTPGGADDTYVRPGGTYTYLRPGGTDIYVRPALPPPP